ncbi:MAG: Hpt domain-containing protein [Arenicella sp.]
MMDLSERAQQLHDKYRQSLPEKCEQLQRSYDAALLDPASTEPLYQALHKLAGSAGMYGFEELSQLSSELLVMLDVSSDIGDNGAGDFAKVFAQLQLLLKNSAK